MDCEPFSEGSAMEEQTVQQIVAELLSSLEPLDTQTSALLHFLKAKGIATDDELAPFLEQAGNAANVRWRAMQVRTAALISNAMKSAEKAAQTSGSNATEESAKSTAGTSKEPEVKKEAQKKEEGNRGPGATKKESSEGKGSGAKKSSEETGASKKETTQKNEIPEESDKKEFVKTQEALQEKAVPAPKVESASSGAAESEESNSIQSNATPKETAKEKVA